MRTTLLQVQIYCSRFSYMAASIFLWTRPTFFSYTLHTHKLEQTTVCPLVRSHFFLYVRLGLRSVFESRLAAMWGKEDSMIVQAIRVHFCFSKQIFSLIFFKEREQNKIWFNIISKMSKCYNVRLYRCIPSKLIMYFSILWEKSILSNISLELHPTHFNFFFSLISSSLTFAGGELISCVWMVTRDFVSRQHHNYEEIDYLTTLPRIRY